MNRWLSARSGVLTAIGAMVTAAATVVSGDALAGFTAPGADRSVRLNQVQVIGAHNAYHREMQGAELAQAIAIDPGYPLWGLYSHASLPDQFARQSIRGIELDLLPDPQGGLYRHPLARQRAGLGPIEDPAMAQPGMKVLHVAEMDYTTVCRTFVACMRQVRDWSRANPRHAPIFVQLELKQTDPRWEALGGAVSPDWDTTLLDAIDTEIRSVFPERDLITADDLRRPGKTLESSVLDHGWPTLEQARGKVLFFFDNGGPGTIRDLYTAGRPNLEGRAVFTRSNPGDPDAAITMVNDPRGANEAVIQDLVRRGYIVRTRSDEPLSTVKNREYSRLDVALRSGAHLVTTDFPTVGMAARYDSDFVAELPGGVPVRCNPVNAPKGCRTDRLPAG